MTTFLEIVNSAIEESGADLEQFAADGSDWDSTLLDSLMYKFKTWVKRAWTSVQQECYDWEWMSEQAVVTINPGIMFYSPDSITWTVDNYANPFTIYDTDDSAAVLGNTATKLVNLTGTYTNTLNLGYIDLACSETTPVAFSMKSGGEYFLADVIIPPTVPYDVTIHGPGVFYSEPGPAEGTQILSIQIGATTYNNTGVFSVVGFDPDDNNLVTFSITDQTCLNALFALSQDGGTFDIRLFDSDARQIVEGERNSEVDSTLLDMTVTVVHHKNYVHSWKSFDWSEELDDDDFVENVAEIDQKSFRIVNHEDPVTASELPLELQPWEQFRRWHDNANIVPSQPRIISKDNVGRWRLFPPADRKYTLLFDYVRTPQILSAFDDVIKGLPSDFDDIIMYRTLMYYGQYDEQPSVYGRAFMNYKELMFRLQMRERPKFFLSPARLY